MLIPMVCTRSSAEDMESMFLCRCPTVGNVLYFIVTYHHRRINSHVYGGDTMVNV